MTQVLDMTKYKTEMSAKPMDVDASNVKRLNATKYEEAILEIIKNFLEYALSKVEINLYEKYLTIFNDMEDLEEFYNNFAKLYELMRSFVEVKGSEGSNFHEGLLTTLLFNLMIELANLRYCTKLLKGSPYFLILDAFKSSHALNIKTNKWDEIRPTKKNTEGFKLTLNIGENHNFINKFLKELNNFIILREDLTIKIKDHRVKNPRLKLLKLKKSIKGYDINDLDTHIYRYYTGRYNEGDEIKEKYSFKYQLKLWETEGEDNIDIYWRLKGGCAMCKCTTLKHKGVKGIAIFEDIRNFAGVNRNTLSTHSRDALDEIIGDKREDRNILEEKEEIFRDYQEYIDIYADYLKVVYSVTKAKFKEVMDELSGDKEEKLIKITQFLENLKDIEYECECLGDEKFEFYKLRGGGLFEFFFESDKIKLIRRTRWGISSAVNRFTLLAENLGIDLKSIFQDYKGWTRIDSENGIEPYTYSEVLDVTKGITPMILTKEYQLDRKFGIYSVYKYEYTIKPTFASNFAHSEIFIDSYIAPSNGVNMILKKKNQCKKGKKTPKGKKGKKIGKIAKGKTGKLKPKFTLGKGLTKEDKKEVNLKRADFKGITVNGENKRDVNRIRREAKRSEKELTEEQMKLQAQIMLFQMAMQNLGDSNDSDDIDRSYFEMGIIEDKKSDALFNFLFNSKESLEIYNQTKSIAKALANDGLSKDEVKEAKSLICNKNFVMWEKSIQGTLETLDENHTMIPFLYFERNGNAKAFIIPSYGVVAINMWAFTLLKPKSAYQKSEYFIKEAVHEVTHLYEKGHGDDFTLVQAEIHEAVISTSLGSSIRKICNAKNMKTVLEELFPSN